MHEFGGFVPAKPRYKHRFPNGRPIEYFMEMPVRPREWAISCCLQDTQQSLPTWRALSEACKGADRVEHLLRGGLTGSYLMWKFCTLTFL